MRISYLLALAITALHFVGCSKQTSPNRAAVGFSQAVAAVTNATALHEIRERFKVNGTDDVVTFFRDGSVEVASGDKTIRGAYREG